MRMKKRFNLSIFDYNQEYLFSCIDFIGFHMSEKPCPRNQFYWLFSFAFKVSQSLWLRSRAHCEWAHSHLKWVWRVLYSHLIWAQIVFDRDPNPPMFVSPYRYKRLHFVECPESSSIFLSFKTLDMSEPDPTSPNSLAMLSIAPSENEDNELDFFTKFSFLKYKHNKIILKNFIHSIFKVLIIYLK